MSAEQLDLTAMVGDIDLVCEANRHRGDEPATWVVWQYACCFDRSPVGLICDECLRRFLTRNITARCRSCGHRDLPRNWILQFERINRPATA